MMLDIKSNINKKVREIKSHAVKDETKTSEAIPTEKQAKDYSTMSKTQLIDLCLQRKIAKSGNLEMQIERLRRCDAQLETRARRRAEYIGLNQLQSESLCFTFEDLESIDERI
jgi:hypothetical protein